MKQTVILSIRGKQFYDEQEPETIELVTEGTMEKTSGGWTICYEESDLTGMAGVTTCFQVAGDQIVLTRTGKLHSQMVFRIGQLHESLYQMEFGALMLSVLATSVYYDIVPDGGVIDLVYNISIENTEAGVIDYHLDIRAK